jgi:hypothetical protein
MALVLSYRLMMEVAAALTLFVDVHRRPRKTNLPNVNIVAWGGDELCCIWRDAARKISLT